MNIKDLFSRKKTQPGLKGAQTASPSEKGAFPLKKGFSKLDLGFITKFDIKELFSGKKQLVGLDIGSSSLKLAEIVETKDGYMLNRYIRTPLQRGVIAEGEVKDIELLAETIRVLSKNSGCQKKGIVISVSGHSVIVKKAAFPALEDAELREIIRDEAGKYLPFDRMEEVYFDFQVLGQNEFNPQQNDVIIVAAKKDIVDSYVEAVSMAGLSVVIVDVDSFALETMYEKNYDYDEQDTTVIVNIGASITNINVVKNATSIFTRDFSLGGNYITEAIQSSFGLSFEEAENMKINGPPGDEAEKQSFRYSLLSYADAICSEIDRSVDYFRSAYSYEEIKRVLLAGGGAMIPGLVGELSSRLGIETEIVQPFRRIGVNAKSITSEYAEQIGAEAAVAVGLALRKVGDK